MSAESKSVPLEPAPGSFATSEDATGGKTYRQILKSSTIIGGASVVDVLVRMIRNKVNAELLGPGGVALIGLFTPISDLVGTISNMGISNSGVRQIAEASGTGDEDRIARTILTLRRVALVLGLAGALGLFLFRNQVATMTFGDTARASDVGWLSLVVFFGAVAGGQAALIQGLRRIGDLARRTIIGEVLGTILSVTLIVQYHEHGIVPALVAVAGMAILTSWWYTRKIKVKKVTLRWRDMRGETQRLLTLGLAFTASGLMVGGVAFAIKLIITRNFGLDSVGYFQSSSQLSIVYAGFILQAMGTDFYPRLTAAAKDHAVCNRMVNEQAEIGLLLAVPGILATLTFAPLVMRIFTSHAFDQASVILRWQILGILLRVVSWPLAFIMLAKEMKRVFLWTEILSNGLHLGLTWYCLKIWGLQGAGIAFFAMYAFYTILMTYFARRITGFTWSEANRRLALIMLPAVIVVFFSVAFLQAKVAMVVGGVISVGIGLYNLKVLRPIVGAEGFDALNRKLRKIFG